MKPAQVPATLRTIADNLRRVSQNDHDMPAAVSGAPALLEELATTLSVKPKPDKWSGVTAPVGSILRSAQLIVDHHVSCGRLVHTSDALANAIAIQLEDQRVQTAGFEANWRLALRERDEARQTAAFAGVKLNEVLTKSAAQTEALQACRVFITPLAKRQPNWDDYKQDAADRLTAILGPVV